MRAQEEHQVSQAWQHAELLAKQQSVSQSLLLNWRIPGARKLLADVRGGAKSSVHSSVVDVGPVPLYGVYSMRIDAEF